MLKKFLLGLIGMFVVYVLVVWAGVLPLNTDAQKAALAVLTKPYERAKGSHNGFQHMWLAPYAIPDKEVNAAYAAELKDYQSVTASGKSSEFMSKLSKKYPMQSLPKDGLCPRSPESCLAFVRANPEQARKTSEEFAAFRARVEKLRDADHARNELDYSFYSPLPPLQGLGGLQTLSAAVDFVEGRPEPALDATCHNLAMWRRLRSRTDLVVVDMIGVAYGRDQMILLADMLAELPVDYPLPQSCSVALSPITKAELDQCDLGRSELKVMAGYVNHAKEEGIAAVEYGISSGFVEGLISKLINTRANEARLAPHMAVFCDGQPTPSGNPELSLADRVFDPIGSRFFEIILTDYSDYRRRVTDFSGLHQTLRTIVWLRGNPDIESALAQQPEDMKLDSHKPALDKATQTLSIQFLSTKPNDPKAWTLPLAASRLPAAVSAQGASAKPASTR